MFIKRDYCFSKKPKVQRDLIIINTVKMHIACNDV